MTIDENYKQGFYTSGLGCRIQILGLRCNLLFPHSGKAWRIPLLQSAGGSCSKCTVDRSMVGTSRKAKKCVLICTIDERKR